LTVQDLKKRAKSSQKKAVSGKAIAVSVQDQKEERHAFNPTPNPPARDLLAHPLTLARVPKLELPPDTFRTWMSRFLADHRVGLRPELDALRWRVVDMAAAVQESVLSTSRGESRNESLRHVPAGMRQVKVRHAYDLMPAFDLLVRLPDDPELEEARTQLESLLMAILNAIRLELRNLNGGAFSFALEAREFLLGGLRAERFIKKATSPEETAELRNTAYTMYYHGRRYYLFALILREEMPENSRMFSLYCNAVNFLARISGNGELRHQPHPKALPIRDEVLFHAQRDSALLHRLKNEPAYAEQINRLLRSFPG
jgi:hypothetical protein